MTQPAPLVFVYNADGGVLNGLKDLWIKTVRPQDYECQLCAVTYGPLGMKREWREFVRRLGPNVRFLHRDELRAEYGLDGVPLPAAFEVQSDGTLREWISAAEMRSFGALDDLMGAVGSRVQGSGVAGVM
ncbi:hypothetical protein E7T06_09210 [Deinococcus sp. Arct2-2]|uniref:hypothetical protein n=1 Tax=Deinococcus sp. Arct2-2 TaxID=2568653 RepID=UPI0010A2AF42|nr:hypothetical protein [Deinococcus sp. Arct2-2]THF70073.1 hypothetical protein E7T06_09210 [Deinococcus sp. Arct2-2]